MNRMTKTVLMLCACLLVFPQNSFFQETVKFGFWTQLWFQHVEDGKNGDIGLNDFIARRAYFPSGGRLRTF